MTCERPTFRGRFPMQIAMCKLFKALANANIKVETMEAKKLTAYHTWRTILRTKVLTHFRGFLRTQDELKHVDMSRACLLNSEGLRILRVISNSSGSSIETLRLTDFFRRKVHIHKIRTVARVFTRFTHLQVLEIDYPLLSDELINALANNFEGTLREMKITLRKENNRSQSISRLCWRQLTLACPDLLVDYNIEGFSGAMEHRLILPDTLPLRYLQYKSATGSFGANVDFLTFFLHIGLSFKGTFETLRLKMQESMARVIYALKYLIPMCSSLWSVDLTMPLPVYFLDSVFNVLLERRTALKLFRLTLLDNGKESFRHRAENLRLKYTPLLKEVGIKLEMNVKI